MLETIMHRAARRITLKSRKPRLDPTRIYAELYQIAGSAPGKGAATLYRARTLCQALYESRPGLRLLEQLRALQAVMEDWTADDARQLPAGDAVVLRERLMDIIDAISGLSEPVPPHALQVAA